jgi:hypothetical protein
MRSQISLFCAAPATVPVNRTSVQNGGYSRGYRGASRTVGSPVRPPKQ